MPLHLISDDITKINADAIVTAARPSLKRGGGVRAAIFRAAGADELQKACNILAPIQAGEAVITNAFGLQAKHIVHTVHPAFHLGKVKAASLLRACYENSLRLAKEHGCKSIAFTLIPGGLFGFRKSENLAVATEAISDWMMRNDMDVSIVFSDKRSFAPQKEQLTEVKRFIEGHYRSEANMFAVYSASSSRRKGRIGRYQPKRKERHLTKEAAAQKSYVTMEPVDATATISEIIGNLDEPFSEMLLRFIDAKGKTDVEVYKRANIDRRLFSKIRTGSGYMPSKKTIVALAVALELTLPETRALLERAGYALSRSVIFDVIVEYFISHGQYDIFEINNVLFQYDQPLLGG